MAEGAIGTYLKTVKDQFKFQATWPPGALVELGDIGVIKDGAFIKTSGLADKGIRFGRERREAPSLRFASSGAVSFSGSMSGETDKAISAIAKLDAGLKIIFKKEGAIVFVMDPASDEMIRDVDKLSDWMDGEYGKKPKNDQVVITHIRRAGSGVIAMASQAGAEIQLKTNAKIGKAKVTVADVKGKLELVASTDTEFVSVPHGRSGATPLYRMLHYHSGKPDFLPTWFPWPGGHDVALGYAKRMTDNVGLYPAPETLRGGQALRFGR